MASSSVYFPELGGQDVISVALTLFFWFTNNYLFHSLSAKCELTRLSYDSVGLNSVYTNTKRQPPWGPKGSSWIHGLIFRTSILVIHRFILISLTLDDDIRCLDILNLMSCIGGLWYLYCASLSQSCFQAPSLAYLQVFFRNPFAFCS